VRPKQKDKLAKFFYKLAEYTFAGLVIGTIATKPPEFRKLLLYGIASTLFLAAAGFNIDGIKERRK